MEAGQAEVGIVRESVVGQLQLQGGLSKEEVPQPMIGQFKAVQLHHSERR